MFTSKIKSNLSIHEYMLAVRSYGFKSELIYTNDGRAYLYGSNPIFSAPFKAIKSKKIALRIAENVFCDL